MSNLWLETFLGNTGKYLIRFIDSYYFYLIPIVLLYGVFMTVSSYNLKRLEKRAATEIVREASSILKKNPGISYTDLLNEISIDWENLIRKYSFFPFISAEAGLWVYRTNIFNVREIIMHNERKIHLTLERKGILILKDRRRVRRNLYLEFFQRIRKN